VRVGDKQGEERKKMGILNKNVVKWLGVGGLRRHVVASE
jgi:hypothetical protein